nr:MAG TPA: hypothetical protein [Caudoviricetes sp.]
MVKVKVVRGAVDMDGDKLPFYLWGEYFTVIEEMPTYSIIMTGNRTFKFKNEFIIKEGK